MVTEKDLIEIGFEQHYTEDEGNLTYEDVDIWNFNDEYWVIEMLDQYRINRQYHTLEELNVFFSAIGKPLKLEELFKSKEEK